MNGQPNIAGPFPNSGVFNFMGKLEIVTGLGHIRSDNSVRTSELSAFSTPGMKHDYRFGPIKSWLYYIGLLRILMRVFRARGKHAREKSVSNHVNLYFGFGDGFVRIGYSNGYDHEIHDKITVCQCGL